MESFFLQIMSAFTVVHVDGKQDCNNSWRPQSVNGILKHSVIQGR